MIDDYDRGVLARFTFNSEVLPSSYVLKGPFLPVLLCSPLFAAMSITIVERFRGTDLLIVSVVVLVSDDFEIVSAMGRQ